jgi:hypothetical protein
MGLQILCQLCRVEEQECELLWAFPKSGRYCLVLSAAEAIGRSKQPTVGCHKYWHMVRADPLYSANHSLLYDV